MLKAEGILTIHPRSGIQFVHPGLELTRATYRFRSIIERAAMRVFAKQSEEVLLESLTTRHLSLITKIEAAGLLPVNLPDVDVPEHSGVRLALTRMS